jgi:hypothetical protein
LLTASNLKFNPGTDVLTVPNLTVTGTLTGGGGSAGVTVINSSTAATHRLLFTSTATGGTTTSLNMSASLIYNPSTADLSCGGNIAAAVFVGPLNGRASSANQVVTATDDTTNAARFIAFSPSNNASNTPSDILTSTLLTYNPASQTLIVPNLTVTGTANISTTTPETEYTFSQASYYGTTPTFNLFNMAAGSVSHGGGSLTIGTNTGVSQLTKTYHVNSNPLSTANGQASGWVGSSTFPFFFVGQGFKITYSFGLADTSTNASTRTMIGFGNFNLFATLGSTATVAGVSQQFLGIIQETGENFFSFYSKGPGATGTLFTQNTVTCQTPSTGWYTVTFLNDANSSNVTITLKFIVNNTVTTATQTIACGGANTLSTSQACYPLLQRAMSATGGTTGAAILAINGLKFYTR